MAFSFTPLRSTRQYSAVAGRHKAHANSSPSNRPLHYRMWHSVTKFLKSLSMKTAFSGNRWAILAGCSIHIPPLAITTTLLALNFSVTYYEDLGTRNQSLRLNALQFAAKLHEVLIVASLSTVAINYLQHQLLGERHGRLSIGGVLASFQVTNINSLWTSGLWNKCLTAGFRTRRLRFVLLVVILVILAAIVGPSSAILILPTIGWWETSYRIMQKYVPQGIRNPPVHFYAPVVESALWPTHINLGNFMPSGCTFVNISTPDYCPAGGFSKVLAQATSEWGNSWNVTLPTTSHTGTTEVYTRFVEGIILDSCSKDEHHDVMSFLECYSSQTTHTIADNMLLSASSESDFRSSFMGRVETGTKNIRYGLSLENRAPAPAPQTFSICNSTITKIQNLSHRTSQKLQKQLKFPTIEGPTWTVDSPILLNLWNDSNPTAAVWIDPPNLGNNTPSIATALVSVVQADEVETPSKFNGTIEIVQCSSYVYWLPVETYIEPSIDSYIHSSIGDEFWTTGMGSYHFPPWYIPSDMIGRRVQLDAEWASRALPPPSTLLQLAPKMLVEGGFYRVWEQPLGTSTSVLLTDAMSRIGMNAGVTIALDYDSKRWHTDGGPHPDSSTGYNISVTTSDQINKSSSTAFMVETHRNGYGYSMNGFTRRLAAAILLLHIFIAFSHTALVVSYGWSSRDLRSLGELLLLGINSPPSNTTRGSFIAKEKLQDCTVVVREMPDSQLALVFDDDRISDDIPLQDRRE